MADTETRGPPPRSRLRLRPPPVIALAFCLGPAAGLTALWMLMLAITALSPGRARTSDEVLQFLFFYAYLVIIGGVVCLVFELLFITPLLVGFHRHRWRWLNGWTGALIGFALAFAAAALFVLPLPATPDETVWGTATMVGGHRTLAGWGWALAEGVCVGVVGLVAAAVFRVIAVETDPTGAAP